jgi:phosphoribosyl-AMP cyclohydrolase
LTHVFSIDYAFTVQCSGPTITSTIAATGSRAAGRDLRSDGFRESRAKPRPTGGVFLFMDYSKLDGLIPAVVQDADSAEVLMVGFMNAQALAETRRCGYATFFSRTRETLWTKGETSGNRLKVLDILVDCDEDTVLLKVQRLGDGNVCHTGQRTCFYRTLAETEVRDDGTTPAGAGKRQ